MGQAQKLSSIHRLRAESASSLISSCIIDDSASEVGDQAAGDNCTEKRKKRHDSDASCHT
jgi:hypothetical protein